MSTFNLLNEDNDKTLMPRANDLRLPYLCSDLLTPEHINSLSTTTHHLHQRQNQTHNNLCLNHSWPLSFGSSVWIVFTVTQVDTSRLLVINHFDNRWMNERGKMHLSVWLTYSFDLSALKYIVLWLIERYTLYINTNLSYRCTFTFISQYRLIYIFYKIGFWEYIKLISLQQDYTINIFKEQALSSTFDEQTYIFCVDTTSTKFTYRHISYVWLYSMSAPTASRSFTWDTSLIVITYLLLQFTGWIICTDQFFYIYIWGAKKSISSPSTHYCGFYLSALNWHRV